MGQIIDYCCRFCFAISRYEGRKKRSPKVAKTHCKQCGKWVNVYGQNISRSNDLGSSKSGSLKESKKNAKTQAKNEDPSVNVLKILSETQQNHKNQNQIAKISGRIKSKDTGILPPRVSDMFQCHSIRYKIPIKKNNPYFVWDKTVPMNGWTKFLYLQKEFKVELGTKHIIINISKKLFGNDYNEILNTSEKFAWEIVSWLQKQGFKLGNKLELAQKPHIVLPTSFLPELRKMGASYLLSDENGLCIDDSPDHGQGEIEYISGKEKLDKALDAPNKIKELYQLMEQQQQIIFNQQQQIKEFAGIPKEMKAKEKTEVGYFT